MSAPVTMIYGMLLYVSSVITVSLDLRGKYLVLDDFSLFLTQ